MIRTIRTIVGLIVFLTATTTHAVMPEGKYLEGKDLKGAVILAHGQGLVNRPGFAGDSII